jgi:acetylornithine deacetylase/succinyl-diaminopimelate desuccinylase-like protein
MKTEVKDLLQALEGQREELADLVLHLANTYGPVGQEEATANAVHQWYVANGISSEVVKMVENRANVVARLKGTGQGRSLIFNAHLDTEASGPDFDNLMQVPDANKVGGRREGDRFFGHTALNDRHAHALFMFAARAIKQSGIPLSGDLILTSVAGETGQSPVDEYKGLQYEGKGFGSTYLVEHGVRADFAIVSETSNFALNWHNCGANYYKVTVRGRNMYTPRLKRGATLREEPNAILKAAHVVTAIETWAVEYTRSHSGMTVCGPVVPNAQVGAIRGGIPWRPNRSSPYCALYVDVRTLPDADLDEVTRSLRAAIDEVGVDAELDLIMSKRGALGVGIEPLAESIHRAHQVVRGGPPREEAEVQDVSMWRDTNVFNKAGIPAINFGPSRGQADVQGRGYLELDHLVQTAQMYALIALDICSDLTQEDLTPDAGA